MVSERIDIIDLQGQVIRADDKHLAHQHGWLHKTVIGQVYDSQGRVLLVKQSADRQDANQLVCPVGGHVKSGESEEDAIRREALEELGINNLTLKLVGRSQFERHVIGRHENHLFVQFDILSDDQIELGDEAVDYQWFTKPELVNLISSNPQTFGDSYHFCVKTFYPHLLKNNA